MLKISVFTLYFILLYFEMIWNKPKNSGNTIYYINWTFYFANLYRFDNLNASSAIFINTIIQKYWIDLKRIKRIHKNVIYCHSVFPPRFPDLRWPHCTPYRLYKKFFPIFLTLFVPPLQTYEVMLPRSKLMCSLFYCLLSLPQLLLSVEGYLIIFSHLMNVIGS